MKSNKDPCIQVCVFSGPKGWCIGCGRTRQECQKWKAMKPYAKNAIENELKKRLTKINAK